MIFWTRFNHDMFKATQKLSSNIHKRYYSIEGQNLVIVIIVHCQKISYVFLIANCICKYRDIPVKRAILFVHQHLYRMKILLLWYSEFKGHVLQIYTKTFIDIQLIFIVLFLSFISSLNHYSINNIIKGILKEHPKLDMIIKIFFFQQASIYIIFKV